MTHGEGPLLIFAGAGSGKTRVLTHRIAYLIAERGVSPSAILAVTFTNKAADEMKGRVIQLVGRATTGMWIGTFHSMCARILRASGRAIGIPPDFSIYDTADQEAVMRQALEEIRADQEDYRLQPRAVLNTISSAKNELLGPEEFARTARSPHERVVAAAYREYQRRLAASHALDFDDLIRCTVELFEKHPEILEQYQNRFAHVLVDEYQDINFAQYRFIKMLAEKHRNICVVGDDDQSIYRWRGADVRIILQFDKDFPEATVIKLEQNYRSTQVILDAAYHVIKHNPTRAEKRLWTERKGGEPVLCYEAIDESEEATWVCQQIEQAVANGYSYGDFAILYRTNAQSRILEEKFVERGIPYRLVGGLKFYERREIKDILAYLRVLINPFDHVSLRRIINTPARGIGPTALERLDRISARESQSMVETLLRVEEYREELGRSFHPLARFAEMLRHLIQAQQEMSLPRLIAEVLNVSGYEAALLAERSAEAQERLDNVRELQTAAEKYEAEAEEPSLAGFLERSSLASEVDEMEDGVNQVTLMTLHSAKGLEFRTVIIVGMEESLFPHARALHDEVECEEERRLCYVGMTRAKDRLILTHARRRTMFGRDARNEPSRFLRELPEELVVREGYAPQMSATLELDLVRHGATRRQTLDIAAIMARHTKPVPSAAGGTEAGAERPAKAPLGAAVRAADGLVFKAGMRVRHKKFGRGIVVGTAGKDVTVAFEKAGVKKLDIEYAPMERLD